MGVYDKVELEARTEIKWETYVKKIQIEARVLGDLAMNHIVPIASKYESVLLDKAWKMHQLGIKSTADTELIEDMRAKAVAYHDTVAVYFDKIRTEIDRLEEVVDDQIWTLPKYREMLFIK